MLEVSANLCNSEKDKKMFIVMRPHFLTAQLK